MKKYIYLIIAVVFMACDPDRDDDYKLSGKPAQAAMDIRLVEGDSNRVVITDLTEGSFQRLWDLPGGIPKTSGRRMDTILYTYAGEYTITLHASGTGGGTSSVSQKVVIETDVPLECTPKYSLLTGGCGAEGKCWTFTTEAGAVKVGPTDGDFSWYTSPVNGLQDAQYDDSFCFSFTGFVYENRNNGQSVNPWNGYAVEDYQPGISEFILIEGAGTGGRDQLIIPDDQFMGVWDFDNIMDIQSLTEDMLVLRGRIRQQNGQPAAEGWFELTFIPR